MLANGNVRAEQLRVHWPRANMHIVDVAAVDADQRRAMFSQPVRSSRSHVRVIAKISVGPPMAVPAGVDEHRLAGDIAAFEVQWFEGQAVFPWSPDDDSRQVRERRKRQVGGV